jgi:uncharacterized protein YqeY
MLLPQIKSDMVAAMKAKDEIRVQTLRGCMAAFTNELVAKNMKPTEALDDAGALTVLKRLAKQRKDSIEQFTKGGRADMADKEASELKIIESYLPAQATRDEILAKARELMAGMDMTDKAAKGKLTGAVMKALSGNADGGLVKEVIDSLS